MMIVVQNVDGGWLVGPFKNEELAASWLKLMPYPNDWELKTVDEPEWDDEQNP